MYDALIVGGQLGGMVAATLLAKRGFKVAWLEHDGLHDAYEYQGYLFPYAPSILPSLKELPIFDGIMAELGLTEEIQKKLRPNHPSLQWVLPRHRLDLAAEASALHAELKREFPKSATALEEALRKWSLYHPKTDDTFRAPFLPSLGLWETLKAQRALKSLSKAAPTDGSWVPDGLLSLRQGLLPFLQYSAQSIGTGPQLRPLSQVLLTSYHFPGGRQGLLDLLRQRLEALGGTVFPRGTVAEELLFDRSRVMGVKATSGIGEVLARTVLIATDAGALVRLVKHDRWLRRLKDEAPHSEIEQFQLALNWVLPKEALPMGMGELVYYVEESEAPILVQVSPARKADNPWGEAEEVNVCAGTFVPARLRGKDASPLQDTLHTLTQRLESLMPFANKAVKHMSSPYLHASSRRASRLMPHPLFRQGKPAPWNIGGLRMKTPAKNLLLANREVLPGLGFEGELLTGNKAARWAQAVMKPSKA